MPLPGIQNLWRHSLKTHWIPIHCPSVCWAPGIKMGRRGFSTYLSKKKPYGVSPVLTRLWVQIWAFSCIRPSSPSLEFPVAIQHPHSDDFRESRDIGTWGIGFAVSAAALLVSPSPTNIHIQGLNLGVFQKPFEEVWQLILCVNMGRSWHPDIQPNAILDVSVKIFLCRINI